MLNTEADLYESRITKFHSYPKTLIAEFKSEFLPNGVNNWIIENLEFINTYGCQIEGPG